MKIQQSRKRRLPKWLLPLLAGIVILGGYTIYAKTADLWPFTPDYTASTKTASTTSGNDGADISPQTESHIENGGGTGQDNSSASGTGISDTDGSGVMKQSDGVTSQSGNITLYSPVSNQTLAGEVTVKGAAKVSEVFYRISDNVNGVIGSGRLSVHDGYFSGKLSANTNATEGTFEVYSLNAQGQEVNNISIKVKY